MPLHHVVNQILGIVQAIQIKENRIMADFQAFQAAMARMAAAVTSIESRLTAIEAELGGSATDQATVDAATEALNAQAASLEAAATPPAA